jgi:AcrR family transcriptional regulator
MAVGRPARIDRARVLSEALALADERGLGAVTMAALAQRLDVTTMALYRHVANKADLLDGLVELLLAEAVQPAAELPWRERLVAFAGDLRATARRHPSVFPLLLQRPAATAKARQTRDTISLALADAGIPQERTDQMQRLLSTAILGFALSEVAGRFDGQTTRQRDADFELLLELLTESIQSRRRD